MGAVRWAESCPEGEVNVSTRKYTVNQQPVEVLLNWIESDNIAIPEMQRPFVWSSQKVRDLMDSLYRGFPVGYLITWQSKAVPVKGGGRAGYQQILIDGQQRTTALRAAVAGEPVINKKFENKRIVISFNPQTEEFQTASPVLKKQPEWIYDIHEFLKGSDVFEALDEYLEKNPDSDRRSVASALQRLMNIKNAQIGIISLSDDLDIETVTEIFVRINSKGVPLSSSDFVMSKVSAYGEQGRNMRKLIDYFAHLAKNPQAYQHIAQDKEFVDTKLWAPMRWLKDDTEDLYDPSYVDIIRVSSMLAFRRGRISDVVRELSGLNPETRSFEAERVPLAFDKLEAALLRTVNEYNFKKFLMIVKSAGFIDRSLITSANTLNFAYALFLIMREGDYSDAVVSDIVRRWFVMTVLTGRVTGSFESTMEQDLRRIEQFGAEKVLEGIERSELSDAFWTVGLPQRLNSSSINNPQYRAYLAARVKTQGRGFLSKHLTVQAMIEQQGDIHHLVPKDYLRKRGVNNRADYNQVANYALTETAINVRIGNRAPADYLAEVEKQFETGVPTLCEITDREDLLDNLRENAIPEMFRETTVDNYQEFLEQRRELMGLKLKEYYESL